VLTQDASGIISGNLNLLAGCPCGKGNCGGEGKSRIWPVEGQLIGLYFSMLAINPATGQVCTSSVEYDVTIGSDGITATGTYQYAAGEGAVTMQLTPTCAMLLTNTLTASTSGGTTMNATFKPSINGASYTLSKAAELCGFTKWDWVQTITHMPNPSPFYENNLSDPASPINLTGYYVPFHDPPPWGFTTNSDWISYPFLYDPSSKSDGQDWSLAFFTDDESGILFYSDSPADACIPDASGAPSAAYTNSAAIRTLCGNTTTAVGESIVFQTDLAGINQDGSASVPGIGIDWSDNFNGTNGGIAAVASVRSVDPGSGEGGITINGVNAASNYQPPAAGSAAVPSILPQFAFGGGWYSALYFTNLAGNGVSFPVNFVSDASTPLTVPSIAGATTQVALTVNGTAIVEAANQGSLLQGYAGFSLLSGVSGYGVFRQSVAGQTDQEAVVPLSAANATSTTLTWDDTNYITAVAVANPSTVATTVAVALRDENGKVIGTSSIEIPAGGKTEAALRSLPGLSGMVGLRGSAQFTVSSGAVAVLGLRFNGAAFTSIPTTSGAAQSAAATVLPQVAFGGGWYSALYFTNLTGAAVSFPVSFVDDAGTPLTVASLGGTTAQVSLAAYGTAIVEAPNVGNLLQGYAAFTLPAGVYGYGVFRQSVTGRPDQEAVVPFSAASATSNTLTWDETNLITAVAVVNPSSTAATVAVTLWDENGNTVGTSSISLAPNSKTETALRTLPGLSGMVGLRGSARFTATGGNVAVLGLRFDGAAFTSIPTTGLAPTTPDSVAPAARFRKF
jgi:P pilus assembly chaperone PapD